MSDGNITIGDAAVRNRHVNSNAAIARSKLAQRVLAVVTVPLTEFRTWDATAVNLPGTPATDDLGLVTGTWATSPPPYIGTGDLKATTTTRRAGALITLPPDYEAAETVQIRVYAGMITTIADTSCTVDCEVYRQDKEDGTIGSADLVATAAQSINSLAEDDFTFVVTAATLTPGDTMHLRLTIVVTDAATATAVIGAVYQVEVLADLR